MRWIALVSVLLVPFPVWACSFCGPPSGRSTLREELAKAHAVLFGTLKNPQLGSDPRTGTTEFHVTGALKPHAVVEKRAMIVLPKYLPTAAGSTGEAVVFFADRNGQPDALRTQTSNPALNTYLNGLAKLDPLDVTARLKYAFDHLDAADETVSGDAFLEFAKAGDADVLKAKAAYDPAKLRTMLRNPILPGSRLGVFAMLLGLCGERNDAALINDQIRGKLTERTIAALGGILTGIVLLDADAGWKAVGQFLTESQHNYAVRLSAFSTVRYLQVNRTKESKAPILAIYRELLDDRDLADQAIEDLRRWKWWDHTATILNLTDKPDFQAKLMRNAILRYALSCPEATAVDYVAAMRSKDAAWVKSIEERMRDLE
jgi:hypothetical protein